MTPSARGGWGLPFVPPDSATTSGVPPWAEIESTASPSSGGTIPPCSSTQRRTESAAPLRTERFSKSTPLMRVWAVNGHQLGADELALAQAVTVLGQHHDGTAFGRLVGEARELRRVGQLLLGHAVHRDERVGLAVAEA